jgi:MinD-like ATPase involved in chromosome partitioning or flagellar assembly
MTMKSRVDYKTYSGITADLDRDLERIGKHMGLSGKSETVRHLIAGRIPVRQIRIATRGASE